MALIGIRQIGESFDEGTSRSLDIELEAGSPIVR